MLFRFDHYEKHKIMKKVILKAGMLIWCLIAALPAYSADETNYGSSGKFPPQLDGTMMPYDFSMTDSVVPWAPICTRCSSTM